MAKTVTLRLNDETYALFAEAAQAENRSIASLVETAAAYRVREQQFADDVEMAVIRADTSLQDRLKRGSSDARQRKGRFVD